MIDDDESLVKEKVEELVVVLHVELLLEEEVPLGPVEDELVPLQPQFEDLHLEVGLVRVVVLLEPKTRRQVSRESSCRNARARSLLAYLVVRAVGRLEWKVLLDEARRLFDVIRPQTFVNILEKTKS